MEPCGLVAEVEAICQEDGNIVLLPPLSVAVEEQSASELLRPRSREMAVVCPGLVYLWSGEDFASVG